MTGAPVIAIDFETRYDKGAYSVKDLGNWRYCQDPRFEVLSVAVSDGASAGACRPEAFDWHRLHGALLVAHNAGFDRAVFSRLQALGTIPAAVVPAGWRCTACAAAYHGLPRDLAGACREGLGIAVDKSVRDALGQGSLFAQGDALHAYAARDAELCLGLWNKLSPAWPAEEQRLASLTDDMGEYGVRVDTSALDRAAADLSETLSATAKRIPFAPAMSVPAFKAWCVSIGKAPPESTARLSDEDLSDPDPRVGVVVREMQAYRAANRTLSVLSAMRERTGTDGRLKYQLKYFGAAQTGRWSGGGGLNMQNLNRGEASGVDLRGLIIPAEGHVFIVVDYAQIEARVLLWLAREMAMLDWLRGGMDLYEAAARRMLNYTDPRPLKQVDPGLRQLSKGMSLGLGFGMGPGRFVSAAKTLAGVEITFERAKESVTRYRNANRRVVDLWDRLQDAFERKAKDGAPVYSLPLPSGRRLRYWSPAVIDDGMVASQVKGEAAYGLHRGLLAENMVQATARDILAGAWARCVDAGFPPVMSVHDELVFEVPEEIATEAMAEIERIMLAPPAWEHADLLPLAVEAKITRRYGK